MRPSNRLIILALILIALTVIAGLWLQSLNVFLIIIWGGLAFFVIIDLLFSIPKSRLAVDFKSPSEVFVGHSFLLSLTVSARKGLLPSNIVYRLEHDDELVCKQQEGALEQDNDKSNAKVAISLLAAKRGHFFIDSFWLKWTSRFGLIEIITSVKFKREIIVVPDVSPVLSGEVNTQMLPLESGQKIMHARGDGSEFHQLRDFTIGMDFRTIDWKRSARMRELIVRETRAERNHQIFLCVDSGRLMGEQIAQLTKLDRAINAALAMCWASGLAGDLIGFYNFDSRPRLFVPATPGRSAFPRLQRICADLKYESQETNHTLGLTQLASRLTRRSLVIIFSDFVDSITAELMLENIQILARHHFVVYVAMRDPILSKMVEPKEINLDNVAKSVAARQILQERRAVMEKLNRMGVLTLDTTPEELTTDLIARYIEIKLGELI